MPNLNRTWWRAAQRIVAALQAQPESSSFSLPHESWTALQALQRRLSLCQERGWTAAARIARDTIRLRLRWLVTDLNAVLTSLPSEPFEPEPRLGDIYDDLVALPSRFDDVQVDLAAQEIAVTTEPITLEGIALGPFRLVWNWRRLDADRALRVVAEEPNPAACRPEIPHPHVQDDVLCSGDARQSLHRALRSGRLLDYFEIVERVLMTYNAGSSYVSLDEWEAQRCAGCSVAVGADELGGCENCEDDFCDDCRTSCDHCGGGLCADCSLPCTRCERTLCGGCRQGSRGQRLCPNCFSKENADEKLAAPPGGVPNDAAVHANSLGQAGLSAGRGADGDRRLRPRRAG